MQNHITDISVSNDGTVRTRSKWDEGGHPCAEYKNGSFVRKAVCDANSKIAVDLDGNTWTIINYYGRFLDITANHGGQDATDAWRIDPVPAGADAPYIKCSDGREIRSIADPSAIGINKKTGELLVADNTSAQNIKIFDIAGGKEPVVTGSFGVNGGIYSGPEPGAKNDPLKFNGITGVGTDAEGNIYVACDGFPGSESEGGGADLRAFNPDGSLRWRMVGLMFVRAANIDPLGGGRDIYCPFTHYRVDYSKEPDHNMTDWTDVALTIDPFSYPDDPRLVGATNTVLAIVNVNGNKYMYSTDMYNEPLYVHRFDGHIAVPVAVITMGYGWNGDEFRKFYWKHNRGRPTTPRWIWVDQNGDGAAQESEFELFEFGGPAERNSVQSFDVDQHGNMIFANKLGYWIIPTNGFDDFGTPQYSAENIIKIEREEIAEPISLTMKYIEKEDILVEGGGSGWEVLNAHVYENWSDPAERKKRFTIIPPKARVFNVTADHEYVYLTYGITDGPNTGIGGEILVYRLSDGAYVGYISPGPEVANYSGWIDMRQPTYVYATPGGKRIICVEEDGVGKVLVYEWCPPDVNCSTDCTTEVDSVVITQNSLVLKGRQTDTLYASVYPDTICYSKIFWISGDESVVTVSPAGIINSISTGTAWLWAVSEQNPEITDSLHVTVESVPVTSISLQNTGDTLLLPVGSSVMLNIDILPSNAFLPELVWESADQTIASIDSSGLVTGNSEGIGKIKVMSVEGTYNDSCYIEVIPVPVSGVSFIQDRLHIWINDPVFVNYKIVPENANNHEVLFKILNEDIATIGADGLLTGLTAGTTRLIITTIDGGFSDTCELNIHEENTLANTDIGAGCGKGGMTVTEDSIFILEANGADIWNSSDEFHFACRKVSGDMVLIARVRSLKNTDGWAKAGVMFRETMLPGSRFVMMVVTPGNGSSFQWRPRPDNGCEHHTPGDGQKAPLWVKLTREGNIFKGYNSLNGKDWTLVSETESTMSSTLFAGLCLTAHNSNCVLTRSEFDYLLISDDINAQPQTPGTDATLSDLKADGLTIPGFQPEIYNYTIELDKETGTIPIIGAIPTDSEATIKIIQATAIPGNATIEVIAEDEFSKAIYQVKFTIVTSLMNLPENQIKIYPN
ncbi:MAG: Ig-like domain-containing protein, partial [Bacteroidales bacterium]|nr:Ig-like domain-containing protein [Bacteroidales bacterium]